jgi:hypothetical protein
MATERKLGKKTVKGKRKQPSIISYVTWNVRGISHKEVECKGNIPQRSGTGKCNK